MSMKLAINAECKSCSGDSGSLGWRQQVEGCKGVSCNLYNVRPLAIGSKHETFSSRRKAVDAHCKSCIYDQGDSTAKGTWRQQVAECKTTECWIYKYRPMPQSSIKVENI